jgi:NADH:ubiquinone oxidoreductase subunit K
MQHLLQIIVVVQTIDIILGLVGTTIMRKHITFIISAIIMQHICIVHFVTMKWQHINIISSLFTVVVRSRGGAKWRPNCAPPPLPTPCFADFLED